jgi:hypothetical protein
MTLWPMLNIAGAPLPLTAFSPFPPLSVISLAAMSTVTGAAAELILMPPPLFWVMVTRSNVAFTLGFTLTPPSITNGSMSTPAALFDIRLLMTTRLTAPLLWSTESAVPFAKFSKTQFSIISVPLPLTSIAPPPRWFAH